MTNIRALFDPQRGLQRSIEKVISYQASQEDRLKSEISEYIVTESIDEQLEKLLENVQAALESGGGHEGGVWASAKLAQWKNVNATASVRRKEKRVKANSVGGQQLAP